MSQGLAVSFRGLAATSPARGLGELARKEEADLIVLGSRRLGPRIKGALATVSENVLRAAPCAVAVAPRGYRSRGGFVPQRIAVGWIPTDEGEIAREVGCRVARATGGSVDVVTTTTASATVDQLEGRARPAVERVLEALGVEVAVEVHARVGKAPEALVSRSCERCAAVCNLPSAGRHLGARFARRRAGYYERTAATSSRVRALHALTRE